MIHHTNAQSWSRLSLQRLSLMMLCIAVISEKTQTLDHGRDLMKWFRTSPLEYFHPKLEMRRKDDDTFTMYASEKIPAGELLVEVPESILCPLGRFQTGDRVIVHLDGEPHEGVISASTFGGLHDVQLDDGDKVLQVPRSELWSADNGLKVCLTTSRLNKELEKGLQSSFSPDLSHLDPNPSDILPAFWSKAGKGILMELLGNALGGPYLLPPFDPLMIFQRYCSRRGPIESRVRSLLAKSRWDKNMTILVEKLRSTSRGNGAPANDDSHHWDDLIRVHSQKDISAGQEVYSYEISMECRARNLTYGTPELFRDYGFVENYPQRWVFSNQEVIFDIKQSEGWRKSPSLELHWVEGHNLQSRYVGFFMEQQRRLSDFQDIVLAVRDPMVPDREWDLLMQYHKALSIAIGLMLNATDYDDDNCANGSCIVALSRYDQLRENVVEYWSKFRPNTCDDSIFKEKVVETVTSPYQVIRYFFNPDTTPPDTCFSLDDVWQICTSYRPQYHEMAVHFAARFLPQVKRVLFVGGGDSMLLHDILKYPSLEKVVGLEIDQAVTRGAFRYFGAQPHFDDNRVEWWFGDAAKSMLVLPKDYYGSFDLVLVDLSETVTSMSVTKGLDIFAALSLLVKHDGILVKNEYPYFSKQKEVFRHALHIHFYHVQMVCSQSLIFGSHGIDFLRGDFIDHRVHHLLNLLDQPHVRFETSRDYQKNHTNPQRFCEEISKFNKDEPDVQESSPGITMIVEAENAGFEFTSSLALKDLVEDVLQREGLTVVSTIFSPHSKFPATVTVLRQGYVVARALPEHHYCAFDIHLWSSFEKQDKVKFALILAIGSDTNGLSSYRVVTGGMFGVPSWKVDEKNRGPKFDDCDHTDSVSSDRKDGEGKVDDKAVALALEESMSMIRNESNIIVLVICKAIGKQCAATNTVSMSKVVGEVVPIYPCEDIVAINEFSENVAERMLACEKATWEFLATFVQRKQKRIRAIVIDVDAQRSFLSLFHSICKSPVGKARFFADNIFVVAPSLEANEGWRRVFVDSFRQYIFPDEPSFKADINFEGVDGGMIISLASSGDALFFEHLVEFVANVESRGKLVAEVESVRGGDYTFQDPFEVKQFFTDADFDQETQLKQWKSQRPLGLQIIFQFQSTKKRSKNLASVLIEGIKETLINSLDDPMLSKVRDVSGFGDGCVVIALWPEGNLISQWDGRDQIDVNLFTYKEDFNFADKFEEEFTKTILGLQRNLRDVQPRGIGKVVNFAKDLADAASPRWIQNDASALETAML